MHLRLKRPASSSPSESGMRLRTAWTRQPALRKSSILAIVSIGIFFIFFSLNGELLLTIIGGNNKDDRIHFKESQIAIVGPDGSNYIIADGPPYVTYILIDGMSRDAFREELAQGNLPVMQNLINNGVLVDYGISSFPSITGYAFYPFLTGVSASESGILGLRWFDRENGNSTTTKRANNRSNLRAYVGTTNDQMNEDIREDVPMLFERLPPTSHSFSINSYMNRGVSQQAKLGWSMTTAKYGDLVWFINVFSLTKFLFGNKYYKNWFEFEEEAVDELIKDLKRKPKLQWITMGSPDGYHHIAGDDETYRALLANCDRLIGKYIDAAKELDLHEDRLYVVVSDHGMSNVETNVDLAEILRQELSLLADRDISVNLLPRKAKTLTDYVNQKTDVVVAINGNAMCFLYFRNPDFDREQAWRHGLDPDQLIAYRSSSSRSINIYEALRCADDSIEFVIGRSAVVPGAVEIHTCDDGVALIRVLDENGSEPLYSYEILIPSSSGNPLQYGSDLIGVGLTSREWLQRTYAHLYPLAVPRLFQLMAEPHVGDLVVTSKPGYDFGKDYELFVGNYRGAHGGLRSEHLATPYILAGSGVRSGGLTVEAATAEDIGATVLEVLRRGAATRSTKKETSDATTSRPKRRFKARVIEEALSQ